MSVDISQKLEQDAVMDSLLDDSNVIAVLPHEGAWQGETQAEEGDSQFTDAMQLFDEVLYAQEHDAAKLGDFELQRKLEREQESGQEERPKLSQEQEEALSHNELERTATALESGQEEPEAREEEQPAAAQAQPLTAEEIRQSMAGLDAFVQENQLNAGAAAAFPHELCSALGTTPEAAAIDAQGVIDFSAKSVVAGLREIELCGGDFSQIQPMPDSLAMEVGFDACKLLGYDPRGDGVNPGGVAQVARFATLNILKTIHETGFTDPEKINSREAVQVFGNELFKHLGHKGEMPATVARQFGDAWTRRVLSIVGQLRENQERAASQPKSRKASGPRVPAWAREAVRGSKAPKFDSNQDIFSGRGFESALRQTL